MRLKPPNVLVLEKLRSGKMMSAPACSWDGGAKPSCEIDHIIHTEPHRRHPERNRDSLFAPKCLWTSVCDQHAGLRRQQEAALRDTAPLQTQRAPYSSNMRQSGHTGMTMTRITHAFSFLSCKLVKHSKWMCVELWCHIWLNQPFEDNSQVICYYLRVICY